MSIAQFAPGATPNGNGQGGKMDSNASDLFMEAIRTHTSISGENLGAVRMAFAMVTSAQERTLLEMARRAALVDLQLSRHRANEDRLVAWLDEYMHDHALGTDPDSDLAGAVVDVFRQQQTTIQLLKEALEVQKAKVYQALPPASATYDANVGAADAAPSAAPTRRKPGPVPRSADEDARLRQAVITQMQKMARNGWGPTQREWNADHTHGLPTYRSITMRVGTWSELLAAAGLKVVLPGMAADYRPQDEPAPPSQADDAPHPAASAPEAPAAMVAKGHGRPGTTTRQRTILNGRGEPETIVTRRYSFSS